MDKHGLVKYFDEDLFLTNLSAKTKEEALLEMVDKLTEVKSIKNKERQLLALEEIKLKTKQKVQGLRDEALLEREKIEDIYKRISDLVKGLQPLSLLTEDEYLKLQDYKAESFFKVGMGAGAMVAWKVEDERVEEVGTMLAAFPEVSHAYERYTEQQWPYNVYTMVHGESDEEVREVVRRMSEAAGVSEYRVLVTERELKKVAPTYVFGGDE